MSINSGYHTAQAITCEALIGDETGIKGSGPLHFVPYVCAQCDNTHIQLMLGQLILQLSLSPSEAETLAHAILNPQPDPTAGPRSGA